MPSATADPSPMEPPPPLLPLAVPEQYPQAAGALVDLSMPHVPGATAAHSVRAASATQEAATTADNAAAATDAAATNTDAAADATTAVAALSANVANGAGTAACEGALSGAAYASDVAAAAAAVASAAVDDSAADRPKWLDDYMIQTVSAPGQRGPAGLRGARRVPVNALTATPIESDLFEGRMRTHAGTRTHHWRIEGACRAPSSPVSGRAVACAVALGRPTHSADAEAMPYPFKWHFGAKTRYWELRYQGRFKRSADFELIENPMGPNAQALLCDPSPPHPPSLIATVGWAGCRAVSCTRASSSPTSITARYLAWIEPGLAWIEPNGLGLSRMSLLLAGLD